jgi:toxin ParE1/3/4
MPRRKRNVIWSPEAEQDLFDIWQYLASEASARTAGKYLRDINRACERVRTRPLLGRSRDDVMSGLRSVLIRPYVIFYRVGESSIDIVRVLHGRRDLEAIFADEADR